MKGIRRIANAKRSFVFLLIVGSLLVILAFYFLPAISEPIAASAFTAEEETAIEELREEVRKLLEALDTEELEAYLETLPQYEAGSIKEALESIVTGDFSLDYASLWQSVLALVWEEGKVILPAFAVIIAVALLSGILNSVRGSFLRGSMAEVIHFAAYLCVGAALLSVLISVLQAGFSAIESMQRQMEIIYPILLTLMAASGGAVSAGIYRPAVAFLSSAVCEMFSAVVLPTSVAVIVLTFIGCLSDEVKTTKLGDFFKSLNKWLIGLTLGLLGIFLTVQGISAAQYDGLSLRAAKYLVSGSVPIVGGFLSGGLDLVLAGSALIKNAVGSFAVFLLFGVILRPVLLFAAFQIFLRLSAAAAEPVGGKISAFLSRLASDCGFFIAGLCCIAFLYFLTLVLLVCSTGVIF